MSIAARLLPPMIDNRLPGRSAALWLLGLFIALKLVMAFNSLVFTEKIMTSADGIPLASYGAAAARTAVLLFALLSLDQLMLTLVALLALLRYRAMVPLVFLLLLTEQLARRGIVLAHAAPGAPPSPPAALLINWGLAAATALGLALSLWPRRTG